jgi:hypothetical protein
MMVGSHNHRYCAPCKEIKNISDKIRWKSKNYKPLVKICKICAKTFVVNQSAKVYCSGQCQLDNMRIMRYEKQIINLQREIYKIRGKRNG